MARDPEGRMVNFLGYESGHPLVHVFEADIDLGGVVFVSALAEALWAACNLDPEWLTGRCAILARAYRDRRLRSMSVGDVVVIGEGEGRVAMCADSVGFSFVRPDRLNVVTTCAPGTQPWPTDAQPVCV
ncbi:hypothetical protein [Actinomadura miaoliensis]|uniref:hypothetical protein n=1 Tax=Actinomadura miaoliensis TaxID=430685 RepID=UPI0031EF8B7C